MRRVLKSPLFWVLAGLTVVVVVVAVLQSGGDGRTDLSLSELIERVDDGEVETATIKDRDHQVVGTLRDDTDFRVRYPAEFSDELVQR